MKRRPPSPDGERAGHRPRNQRPEHAAYETARKTGGALVCERCQLVSHAGRWYRGAPPLGPVEAGICPACRRIQDGYPAATVRLRRIPGEHRRELDAMLRRVAACEGDEHPLERILDVAEDGDGLTVRTTGVHLARAMSHAVQRRFRGAIDIRADDEHGRVLVEQGS